MATDHPANRVTPVTDLIPRGREADCFAAARESHHGTGRCRIAFERISAEVTAEAEARLANLRRKPSR
jgi:hypothetical protein